MSENYESFIRHKSQDTSQCGFTPIFMPHFLFDFQSYLISWAIQAGRAALFTDTGTGKTPMQLVVAENMVRYTNKPVLILTPLAVSYQTVNEAEKFGIEAHRSTDGTKRANITVTNYEKLHLFNPDDYSSVICDESGIIKNFSGVRRDQIISFMRKVPYRLLCTATAAPNDYHELGNSSEALGYLGFQDMMTRFFRQDKSKDHHAWGRPKYRFKGHASSPFWRWVCSWARSCRYPSDIGFSDEGFHLPPLSENIQVVKSLIAREGMLFSLEATTLEEQREERMITLNDRCEMAAAFASEHDGQSVVWGHLNAETDLIETLLPDSCQVSGSMPDEKKEERLLAFASGEIKNLITKPKIAAFGMNWQNCHHIVTFPSHSWEQYYQSVRRCWRFGQKKPVNVDIITTQGEGKVMANLRRKGEQADVMFKELINYMSDHVDIDRDIPMPHEEILPNWLGGSH